MPCNCARKKQNSQEIEEVSPLMVQEPPEWGPILWTYLHSITERLGSSGSKIIDTDQATYMEVILQHLPLIIPCTDCQEHANQYFLANPLPPLKGLYGNTLRDTVRQWLFDFHQDVRRRKEQPLILSSPNDCIPLYQSRHLSKMDYQRFVQTVAAAVKQGWVRMDHWRKWFSHSEKIRILSGNIVI